MAFANGYDMNFAFNFDSLGILYIIIAILWTLCLIPGATFLIQNRNLAYLRIRNIPLAISAVATLHVYWVLCMIAYVLNGYFPCSTEYWIMSIYLPLGIALYHAANTQLLHVAMLQKKYAEPKYEKINIDQNRASVKDWQRMVYKVRSYSPTKQAMLAIAAGMMLQFVCSMTIFMISRKFHPNFGIVGGLLLSGNSHGHGSMFPIFFGNSVALNTMFMAGEVKRSAAPLLASPMWLIALYVPAMGKVSKYLVPPLWFSPSIILMQAFIILVPCFQVHKNRKLENETRDIIAEWEHKQKYGHSLSSDSTKAGTVSRQSQKSSTRSATSSRLGGEMYTMNSLEKALSINPKRLLLFAALKDFSGENICFLTHVMDWKAKWVPETPRLALLRKSDSGLQVNGERRRKQFNIAVDIYISFISLKYSDFPINIASAQLKELEALFDGPAAMVAHKPEANAATPFDTYCGPALADVETSPGRDQASVVSTLIDRSSVADFNGLEKHASQINSFQSLDFCDKVPHDIDLPVSFGPTIFDKAEKSIKELVLTNTWPKFVNDGFANIEKQTFQERLSGVRERFLECRAC